MDLTIDQVSSHAIVRMVERNVMLSDIQRCIEHGDEIYFGVFKYDNLYVIYRDGLVVTVFERKREVGGVPYMWTWRNMPSKIVNIVNVR